MYNVLSVTVEAIASRLIEYTSFGFHPRRRGLLTSHRCSMFYWCDHIHVVPDQLNALSESNAD